MIQTDNGPEFQTAFVKACSRLSLSHRYIKIRKSEENGIVERFHRTINEEFWQKQDLDAEIRILNTNLQKYLAWFITQRIHLGLKGAYSTGKT